MRWPSAFIVLALLVGGAPWFAAADSFTTSAATLPAGRGYASAVWTGTHAFLFGGEGATGYVASIARFDPATLAATNVASLPSARTGTSAVWTGTHAYVFGGFTGAALDEIVRFTPATGAVQVIGPRLPSPRWDTSAVWTGTHALVFGGFGGTDLSEIVRFDPATGEVRTMTARLPFGRAATSAVWTGTHAIVFGGTYNTANGYVSTTEIVRYDPVADVAEIVANLPAGRFLAGAAWSGAHAYLVGGVNHATGAFATTVRFDPATREVVTVEGQLPSKREGPAAVWADGGTWIFGGARFDRGWQYLTEIVRHTLAAPGAPRSLAATPAASSISLSWLAPSASGSFPVTAYRVYAGDDASSLALAATVTGTSWRDEPLAANATRHYRVAAVNAVGEGAPSATVSATTFSPPGPPRSPSASTGPGVGEIRVAWQPPSFAGSAPVTSYRVYASASATGPETRVGETGGSPFVHGGLAPGAERHYRVAAVSAHDEGEKSARVAARAPDVPGAPEATRAEPGPAFFAIRVAWEPPATDGGLPVTAFNVYRAEPGEAFALHATVDGETTAFDDRNLPPLAAFEYRVTAANAVGEGAPGATACASAYPWHFVPATGVQPACG